MMMMMMAMMILMIIMMGYSFFFSFFFFFSEILVSYGWRYGIGMYFIVSNPYFFFSFCFVYSWASVRSIYSPLSLYHCFV